MREDEPMTRIDGQVVWNEASAHDALVVSLAQPSRSERYRVVTHQAATHERKGHYAMAVSLWVEATALGIGHMQQHWCESRAQWCDRRRVQEQVSAVGKDA